MSKLSKTQDWIEGLPDVSFYCPGCKCDHGVWINPYYNGNGATWSFNGNSDKPTFSPSLKVTYTTKEKVDICHSVITDGKIQFLGDCTHELAGQLVEMEDI